MIRVLEYEQRVCDVCRLLEADLGPKPCAYCGLCASWICTKDLNRWDRRARAFFKRHLEPDYTGVHDAKLLFEANPEAAKVLEEKTPSR